jgi:uncharacterized protein (TIGR03083 family)
MLESYDAMEGLAATLSDDDLGVQSLCPDWDVRGVIGHLGGMESVMAGWPLSGPDDKPDFDRMGAFLAEVDAASSADVASSLAAVHQIRRDDLASNTADDLARMSWSPVGEMPYSGFLGIRVFDYWVHERDITMPLGRDTVDSGPAAEFALAQVESALGYIAGKKVGVPDGKSIAFRLEGPIERDFFVSVDGRAKQVDSLSAPDVDVRADSTTFIMLACGRIDPQDEIDAGRISWTGDAELGESAARNLRYTM